MSNAVGRFLRQIVLQKGIPFEMKFTKAYKARKTKKCEVMQL